MTSFTSEEADLVERHLLLAPGSTYALPDSPTLPTSERLRRADSHIKRCKWCGDWTQLGHCKYCRKHGYPTIDLERKRV